MKTMSTAAYIEEGVIWFPRRKADHLDIGFPSKLIYKIEMDPENDDFSLVYNKGGGALRAFQPAKEVAQTLWGSNYKETNGVYTPK